MAVKLSYCNGLRIRLGNVGSKSPEEMSDLECYDITFDNTTEALKYRRTQYLFDLLSERGRARCIWQSRRRNRTTQYIYRTRRPKD